MKITCALIYARFFAYFFCDLIFRNVTKEELKPFRLGVRVYKSVIYDMLLL